MTNFLPLVSALSTLFPSSSFSILPICFFTQRTIEKLVFSLAFYDLFGFFCRLVVLKVKDTDDIFT